MTDFLGFPQVRVHGFKLLGRFPKVRSPGKQLLNLEPYKVRTISYFQIQYQVSSLLFLILFKTTINKHECLFSFDPWFSWLF